MAIMTVGTVNKDFRVHAEPNVNASATSVLQAGAVVDIITLGADRSWLLVSPRIRDVAASIGWMQAKFVDFDRNRMATGDAEHADLNDAQFTEIVRAVQQWATGHPSADEPLALVRGRVLSPKALASEMERRTELGMPFLSYLVQEAARTGEGIAEPIYRAITANQSR